MKTYILKILELIFENGTRAFDVAIWLLNKKIFEQL